VLTDWYDHFVPQLRRAWLIGEISYPLSAIPFRSRFTERSLATGGAVLIPSQVPQVAGHSVLTQSW